MAPSSISRSYAIYKGSRHYPYPCYVNAASFLSIKLSDKSSYHSWKEQMVCLVESHDMLGFIDGTLKPPKRNDNSKTHANKIIIKRMETKYKEWKRSDTLVKGWIFGSISQDAMVTVIGLDTAKDVWNKLNTTYTTSNTTSDTDSSSTTSSPSSTHSSNISNYHIISNNEDRAAKYITLYKAILAGDWEKAKEIFDMYDDALTAKLDIDGNSALHIAIGTCKNLQFVSNLLDEINPDSLIHLVNDKNSNALHRAAAVGNIKAAKMLVEKKPHLLFVLDDKENLPINKAVFNFQKNTFLYLFKVSKQYIELSQDEGYESPFEGISAFKLLPDVIIAGFLDAAYEMIKDFPTMAIANNEDNDTPLMSIAGKLDLYYSGSQYNFYQRFVYSYVPTENKDLRSSTNMIKDIENQDTCNTYFFTKCRKSYFYPVIQRIYVKFWEVALLHVPHIKNLHEDKVKHNKALMVLKCICEEVGKISRASDIYEHYGDGFNLAVKNDTPEAVEVILEYCPQAIWTQNNGYTCSQFAIRNRCEKVHNFLVHKVTDNKHLLRTFMDKNENNLLHLAGKLAPLHKLNLVSGAALQMQRELQWFQEVEKFVLPSDKKEENKDDETPIMVFRKEHTKLRKEGEEWMKKTADSYTITAALIITIVFAAAITIPGGNSDNGKAIYAREPSFIIFAISDAISLFTSTNSLLLFLSILTTRYREEDFLYKLPKRLILGLTMLFLSVTSLMVAFSATLYLTFASGEAWILIPIAALTSLPIISFVTLQLPLLFDLISSTYFHGIFRKEN